MAACPQTRTADFLEKQAGADNVCYRHFCISEIQEISKESGRTRRVGLRSGGGKRHQTVDLFWARVQKNPNGCWLFDGAPCNRAGHKHLSLGGRLRVYAHRFSYELHHGPIPRGAVVMHTCDVPACVNPAHLRVGSQRENIHDAIGKGRFAPWARPKNAVRRDRRVAHAPTVARPALAGEGHRS